MSQFDDLFSKPDYSLYSNSMSFVRRPMVQNPVQADADVVVLGVPFDMATSGRSGARMGPDAIRRASVNLAWRARSFHGILIYSNTPMWWMRAI